MLVAFLLFLYLVCCFSFVFSLGSLIRIFLIVFSSLVASLLLYIILGFSWYLLLFVLVYVGGVYILFVYMRLVLPNVGLVRYGFSYTVSFIILSLLGLCCGAFDLLYTGNVVVDNKVYLCSGFEFFVYLFFCVVLLLGIVLIKFVVRRLRVHIR